MRLVKSSLTVIGYPKTRPCERQRSAGPIYTDQAVGTESPPAPELRTKAGEWPEDDTGFNIRQLTDVLQCKLQQHFQRKNIEHVS